MRRTSTCAWRLRPRSSLALGRQPPLELGDDPVHGGEVLERAARQRAVELVQRPRRRQLPRALDQRRARARGAAAARSGAAASRGSAVAARVVLGQVGLRLGAQAERAADPLHVDADHARALALRAPKAAIASRARSRIAPSAPSLQRLRRSARAARRGRSASASRRRPRPRVDAAARAASASAARKKKRSNTSSNTRRSSGDFASVAASASRKSLALGPRHLAERRERVEQLGRADRDALAAQLLGEAEQLRVAGPAALSRARPRHRALASSSHADALGDDVEVGAVLDDDAHRLAEASARRCRRRRAAAARAPSRSTRRSRAAS